MGLSRVWGRPSFSSSPPTPRVRPPQRRLTSLFGPESDQDAPMVHSTRTICSGYSRGCMCPAWAAGGGKTIIR